MEFLNETIRSQYRTRQLCLALQEVTLMLECLAARTQKMPKGICITDIYRPNDKDSYHSKWQAVDIRDRDWTPQFHAAVRAVLVALKSVDPCIQHEFEPSDRHPKSAPHLHLEYSDGSLEKGKHETL